MLVKKKWMLYQVSYNTAEIHRRWREEKNGIIILQEDVENTMSITRLFKKKLK